MLLKYMTTNEFVASVKALGLRTRAAKAYDDVETYEAKVLADKQGFALRAEVINVDD